MIRDRERRGYNKKQGLNHLFLILLNSAEDYEKRFGHEMFLQIIAQYPGIKNLKKEQDKSSIVRLVLWILNEKNIREEASRRDIALKLMEEYLIEEKKKAFHFYEESLHKNWRSYLEKLAKEVWDQFDPIKQEKRKQEYLALLESAIKDINFRIAYITAFIEAQTTLEQRRALARRIIDIFETEAIKLMRQGMNGINALPPMDPEHEAQKEALRDGIEKYTRGRDPSVVVNIISPAVDKIEKHIKNHPDKFDYRIIGSSVQDFQNARHFTNISKSISASTIEEKKADVAQNKSTDMARGHLSQLEIAFTQVTQEQEKPMGDVPPELDNLLSSFDLGSLESELQELEQSFRKEIYIPREALAEISPSARSEVAAIMSEIEQLNIQGRKQLQAIPRDMLNQDRAAVDNNHPEPLIEEQKPRTLSFK